MKTIPLVKFIESVKAELLSYQKQHEGEPALFSLEEVELEAHVGTTIGADGTVSVFAVQFGSKAEQTQTHKVRMKFKHPRAETTKSTASDVAEMEPHFVRIFGKDYMRTAMLKALGKEATDSDGPTVLGDGAFTAEIE